jgi:NAD(P)-dependent dehydrogenase (short-subunit alcohol dehydrogenase family)
MSAQEPIAGLRGSIVNTSSGAGLAAAPGQPHYTAAEARRDRTHALGRRSSSRAPGSACNAICPGATDTELLRRQSPEALAMMARMSPARRPRHAARDREAAGVAALARGDSG